MKFEDYIKMENNDRVFLTGDLSLRDAAESAKRLGYKYFMGNNGIKMNTESVLHDLWGPPAVKKQVYIAGSLRNNAIVNIHKWIEENTNWTVFSDWKAAHPDGDDAWRDYEKSLGYSFKQALKRPAAQNIFQFDKKHIDASDAMVLVLPAGKSGHLELGYAVGKGKKTAILLEQEDPERWDIMYQFSTVVSSMMELKEFLG